MNTWLYKLERKYGKLAIHNLTTIMMVCYALGFVIDLMSGYMDVDIASMLTLNPYLILHGQVWRLISWVLIFPHSGTSFIFVLITLLFYFSIGRTMEAVWGDFRYTLYILSGILFTIVGAFILYGIAYIEFKDIFADGGFILNGQAMEAKEIFTRSLMVTRGERVVTTPAVWFSDVTTFYVSMSLFLAYATTFPEHRVLLYFIIPIKVKWLGYLYAGLMVFSVVEDIFDQQYYDIVVIVMSLLNFLLFFFSTRDFRKISPMEARRKRTYREKVRYANVQSRQEAQHEGKQVFTRHKCAICGKTELDGASLQFRYCSKCDGNYEYCEEHLYTHEHVKRI